MALVTLQRSPTPSVASSTSSAGEVSGKAGAGALCAPREKIAIKIYIRLTKLNVIINIQQEGITLVCFIKCSYFIYTCLRPIICVCGFVNKILQRGVAGGWGVLDLAAKTQSVGNISSYS